MSRFLHTADLQIGKPFAGIADAGKRTLVQQERLTVIQRLAAEAARADAEFVVVAGDLFDSPSVTKSEVAAACAALGAIARPVFVIPGNHDHGGPGSIWHQSFFQQQREKLAPNVRVLLAAEPVDVGSAVLLPCPLLRRHESTDTTAWLRTLDFSVFGPKPRLVLAHGSVQGFAEEDGATNLLQLDLLPAPEIDYIALGDWHGMKQVGPRAWYAGTPELDRFPKGESNAPGHVLLVTAERGALPQVTALPTARFGWHQRTFTFYEDADLARLEAEIDALLGQRAQTDLLKLTLSGALGIEANAQLRQRLEAWDSRLLRLSLEDSVRVAPTAAEISALTGRATDPLISRVAGRLLEMSTGTDPASAEKARFALRHLHAACAENVNL